MTNWILFIIVIISYTILITIQLDIYNKLLEIEKILWKFANKQALDIILEKAKKKSK